MSVVMVVHPEPSTAERIAGCARALGHRTVVVPDGERAIDYFVQRPADLVVVHLMLPGRDGAATVETIRWAPAGKDVPVIMSGPAQAADRLDHVAQELGAVATLEADPSPETVMRALRLALRAQDTVTRDVGNLADEAERQQAAASRGAESRSGEFDDDLYTDAGPNGEVPEAWAGDNEPSAWREGRDVERRASALHDMARLEGVLAEVPFPRLLARLADLRATGALVLSSPDDIRATTTGESPKKVVFFRHGVPQHVRSNLIEECLGQVLRHTGQIGTEALEESLRRVRAGEGRQGGVLIAMGAIDPHDLREALEQQQRVKLFDVFGWLGGTFRFSERMAPPSETVTLEMSLAEVVYGGVVASVPPPRLLEMLRPHHSQYVVPVPRRMPPFLHMELPDPIRRVLHAIDGTQQLRDLLAITDRAAAAAQLVYALECVGAVHYKREPRPVVSHDQSEVSWLPWGEGRSESGPHKPRAAPWHIEGDPAEGLTQSLHRGRVRERVDRMLGRNEDDVVEESPPAEGLRAAPERARDTGVTARRPSPPEPDVDPEPPRPEIGSPEQEPPRPEIGSPEQELPRQGHAVDQRPPPGPRLGAEPDQGTEPRLVSPKERRPEKAGAPKKAPPAQAPKKAPPAQAERRTARHRRSDGSRPTPAGAGAGGLTKPGIRRGSPPKARPEPPSTGAARRRASGGEPEHEQRPTLPEPSPPAFGDELDDRVERLVQAEHHFRRGERALRRNRAAEAVVAFEQAVELCPGEGEFLAWLGYARQVAAPGDPAQSARAIDELTRGCRRAPKLDVPHVLRARVLRARGDIVGARNAYEQALAANPGCEEALEGLRELAS